jgi:hypothetical protein
VAASPSAGRSRPRSTHAYSGTGIFNYCSDARIHAFPRGARRRAHPQARLPPGACLFFILAGPARPSRFHRQAHWVFCGQRA